MAEILHKEQLSNSSGEESNSLESLKEEDEEEQDTFQLKMEAMLAEQHNIMHQAQNKEEEQK